MRLRTVVATLFMTAALSGVSPARIAAQAAAPRSEDQSTERVSAESTRQQFREVMREYPPALTQVFRLDPSLMANPGYLTPYPRLATYLAQHPEILHNPAYFIGESRADEPRLQTMQAVQEAMAGLAFFLFFMTALGVAIHIGRSILEHRRLMHAMKVQTDTHTKLLDRLSTNEELMAYIQSPVGQRLLSSTPVAMESDRRHGVAAPVARILTSVQIGVVAACGGTGLWIAKARVIEEVAQPLHVIAILAIALGVGFVVSAFLSYGLSEQMGLMKRSSNA